VKPAGSRGVAGLTILEMSTESGVQMAFIQPLVQHFRTQGHEVVLACSDNPGEAGQSFVGKLRNMGFEVLVLPIRRTISPWSDLWAVLQLYAILRNRRFDIVHVQTAKAGMIGRIAAWLASVPTVIYTAHAFPFHEHLGYMKIHLYAFLERLAAHFCHVITVDSEHVRSRGLAFRVAPPDKIRVISMGVDTERFRPVSSLDERDTIQTELGLRRGGVVIGTVARLVPDKGLDVLLRAVALLAQRIPDLQCVLVGDGPLRADLQRLSVNLGIADRVVFCGYRTDVPRTLAALDVYMLPTRREGFGVAFAEAMSAGVPVVVSRIAPVSEIVEDGATGMLATCDDPADFARAAELLLIQPELRQRMGQAGRQRVIERFQQDSMCRAYERLFQEFAGR